MKQISRWSARLILLGVLCISSACSNLAPGVNAPATLTDAAPLVWPKPPVAERIRYLRSINGPSDWGISRSWWRRLADTLSGRGKDIFIKPSAVVERAGVLTVADPGAQAVWILDAPNDRYQRVAQVGQQALTSPVAVALGPQDSVFVADTVLNQVFHLDRDGSLLHTISTQGLARPAALAWDDATHRLFVLDSKKHRVTVFDGNGALLRHIGESGSDKAQFNHPTHMALDAGTGGGNLLVTDAMNFRIKSLGSDGKFLWQFGKNGNGTGDLAAPKGVASDKAGHVYVVDALFDAVQIFDRQGRLLLAFGEHGTGPGQFALPRGIFIAGDDKVYVADAYNQRVQVFLGALASRPASKEVTK
ncbi:MAG: hypothetical protein PHH58_15070 [Rhodoferax sp.]|nr:hypothetical protein [Rhodoferax sp.]